METSYNQCQDLKAKYEKASSETKTKHEEILQNLQKMLADTEDKLKAAQEANRDLMQDMEELKTQADKAKVCSGAERVHLGYILVGSASRLQERLGTDVTCACMAEWQIASVVTFSVL